MNYCIDSILSFLCIITIKQLIPKCHLPLFHINGSFSSYNFNCTVSLRNMKNKIRNQHYDNSYVCFLLMNYKMGV